MTRHDPLTAAAHRQPESGPEAPTGFEAFLDKHLKKLIAGVVILLASAAGVTIFGLMRSAYQKEAGAALTAAEDLESLRAVAEEYGDVKATAGTALLLIADRQVAADDAAGAAETLRAFVGEHPDHPLGSQAKVALAQALIRTGNDGEADTVLADFIASTSTSPLAPLALLVRAEIAERRGDADAARDLLDRAATDYPNSLLNMPQFGDPIALAREQVGFTMPKEVDPPPPAPAPENDTDASNIDDILGGLEGGALDTPLPEITIPGQDPAPDSTETRPAAESAPPTPEKTAPPAAEEPAGENTVEPTEEAADEPAGEASGAEPPADSGERAASSEEASAGTVEDPAEAAEEDDSAGAGG